MTATPYHLTHLALVHVPWTLVVVREGDEVGDHTQQAMREELLVRAHSSRNLVLKDGDIHEDLGAKGKVKATVRVQSWGLQGPMGSPQALLP